MNGKQARRLRKMAFETAKALAKETGVGLLDAKPQQIYQEMKKIHNTHKGR